MLLNKNFKAKVRNKQELEDLINETIESFGNHIDLNFIDVSNITDMSFLFANSEYDGDISEWDVRNVENMDNMFYYSKFNSDISDWKLRNIKSMSCMFTKSEFNQDLSKWNLEKKPLKTVEKMFLNSKYSFNIENEKTRSATRLNKGVK